MARVTVALLGGFRVQLGSGHPLSFPTKKAQALLAYLAIRPGQAYPRDKLAALLWPDTSNEHARQSLRQALTALRRLLPSGRPRILQAEGETLAVDATGLSVDVVEFERHLARGMADSLARAAELYRGDLLEGFRVTEPPFEEWLQAERERLRQRAFQGLTRLLAHQERAGPVETAIETARRLLALDPLQETVHCQLIRLHARQGRLGEATRQYEVCVRLLAQELGAAPAPATRALYESLRQGPTGQPALDGTRRRAGSGHGKSSGAAVAPGALIGRDEALARLGRALDEVWQGRGRVALVVGEAGVGKSRLIEEVAARMERRGGSILVGRCYESEQILPFGPWVDALRSGRRAGHLEDPAELVPVWRDELTRLLPELARPGAPLPAGTRDHLRLFEAVGELVLTLGSRRPSMLVIEDLHWADELSQRLMAFISRRLGDARVLLVGTAREEELASGSLLVRVMSEMRAKVGALDVPLRPLSRGDTDRLVHALTGGGDDELLRGRIEDQVWRVSEGNPFTVLETIRALQEGGGAGALAGLTVPERVREVILGRVARLPDRERRVIAVASVIGRESDLPLLARGAGLGVAEATRAAEALRERRLLVSRGDRLDVTHDRIRAAIADDLLPARRRLLHRAVAEAMEVQYAEDLTPHWAALGTHYREAEVWDKAVVYLRRAGRAAIEHAAHREALVLFEQALSALGHLPPTRDRLEQAYELRFDLRHSLFPLPERRQIVTHLREAETLAQALGDPMRLANVHLFMANEQWMHGDQAGALDSVRRAQDLGRELQDRELELVSAFRLGQIHHNLGQYGRGVELLRDAISSLAASERFRIFNVTPLYPLCCGWLAWNLIELGDFDEAIHRGREALDIVESVKNGYGIAHACFNLGRAYLLRGELGPASQVLERGLEVCQAREFPVLSVMNRGELGYGRVLAGRIGEGTNLLAEAVQQAEATGIEFTLALYLARLGEAHARAGRSELALDSARRALDLATSRGERGHEAYAHRALALAAGQDRTGYDQAARHFQDALDLATSLDMRPLVAHCRLGLGRLHRLGRDRAGATRHLAAAGALFSDMKMSLWREEAQSELSALGADGTTPRGSRPPRRTPSSRSGRRSSKRPLEPRVSAPPDVETRNAP